MSTRQFEPEAKNAWFIKSEPVIFPKTDSKS